MRGVAEGEEELGGNGGQDVQAGEEEKKKGALYAALGYSFGWNKLDVCYAFCIYIRIREIGIERNFVVQWSVFKNKEKRGLVIGLIKPWADYTVTIREEFWQLGK
ncbi:hypothetical protein YC2023_039887 [Brassica napus]